MVSCPEAEHAAYDEHGWDGTERVGIAFSGPEGAVDDEGWGPDVDSDEEERAGPTVYSHTTRIDST